MRHTWVTRVGIALFLVTVAHCYSQSFNPSSNWPMYYASAAFTDANIVLALNLFGRNSLVRDLQYINYTAIVVHAIGWCMYMAYLPPTGYDAMLYTLIALQWLRLLKVDPDDRDTANNFRLDMVLHSYRFHR